MPRWRSSPIPNFPTYNIFIVICFLRSNFASFHVHHLAEIEIEIVSKRPRGHGAEGSREGKGARGRKGKGARGQGAKGPRRQGGDGLAKGAQGARGKGARG